MDCLLGFDRGALCWRDLDRAGCRGVPLTSVEVSEPSSRKVRQTQEAILDNRDIRAALSPLIERVGRWQRTLALMKAKISRGNTGPLQLLGACRAIAQEVASGRRLMQRVIPDRLRSHGRVLDIERALAMIEFQAADVQREPG